MSTSLKTSSQSPEFSDTSVPGTSNLITDLNTPRVSQTPSIAKQAQAQDPEKDHQDAHLASEPEAASPANSTANSSSEAKPQRTVRGFRWLLVCLSLYFGTWLYGLDTTIAADVQGPVVEAFGNVDKLSWIGSGFPLGSVAVILLVGNLYATFNMKWVFVTSFLIFGIGSALCGAAPNMEALIVGRVIAGAGGSGVYLGSLNMFGHLTTPEERGLYVALIGFSWGVGAVLGPIIGGAFSVSAATWRWSFYINLVVGGVVAPVYIFILPSIRTGEKAGKSLAQRVAHYDILGLALIAATWVLFTVSFSLADSTWSWSDGRTIALVVVFVVLLLVTIAQQYFSILTTPALRSFPGHLLRSRTQVLLFMFMAANSATLFLVVYFVPIYFQFVHNDSAIQAAVRLLPFIIVTVIFNVAAGWLLSTINYYMPIYLGSGVFVALGGALLTAYLDVGASQASIYGYTVLVGVGTGVTLQLGYAVATACAPVADLGNVISFTNVSQIGSGVLALVIAGQIYQSEAVKELSAALAGNGFGQAEIVSAVAGAQGELFRHLDGGLRAAAVRAIVKAMQKAFALVVVAGGVMVLSSLGMKREKLFK